MANNKSKKAARHKRKKDSFEKRYGMTASEWAKWKREHTASEVVAMRERAYQLIKK